MHYFFWQFNTITQEEKKKTRQMIPFLSSTFWALFVIFIFVFENCQNSFSMGPPFGPFWSAKYLDFGGESTEIRILSCSIQETYTLRKVKNKALIFLSSWEPVKKVWNKLLNNARDFVINSFIYLFVYFVLPSNLLRNILFEGILINK